MPRNLQDTVSFRFETYCLFNNHLLGCHAVCIAYLDEINASHVEADALCAFGFVQSHAALTQSVENVDVGSFVQNDCEIAVGWVREEDGLV